MEEFQNKIVNKLLEQCLREVDRILKKPKQISKKK